jgi:peptidyl-prolyl cis-trans isomerase C
MPAALAVAACFAFSAPAFAAGKDAITVNGEAIPQYVVDAFVAEQPNANKNDPEFQKAVTEELVRRQVVVDAAEKLKLDQRDDVRGQLALTRQAVLISAYMRDYLKANPVSETQMKKDYDAFVKNLGATEYHVRHILVKDEKEAKQIIAELHGKSTKFAEIAKAKSEDLSNKTKGGDLGWMVPSSFVQPFSDALKSMKKGEISKVPVQTKFGWHVIWVENTRPFTPPTFEQLKPQLQQRAEQQQVQKLVNDLLEKAKVKK